MLLTRHQKLAKMEKSKEVDVNAESECVGLTRTDGNQ
jgi:hypothetical protein